MNDTKQDHYKIAEALLEGDDGFDPTPHQIAAAQVHALLAQVDATRAVVAIDTAIEEDERALADTLSSVIAPDCGRKVRVEARA